MPKINPEVQIRLRQHLDKTAQQPKSKPFALLTLRRLAETINPTWNSVSSRQRKAMIDDAKDAVIAIAEASAENSNPLLGFVIAPVVKAAFLPAFQARLASHEPLLLGSKDEYEDGNNPEDFARTYVLAGRHSGTYKGVYLSKSKNGELATEWRSLVTGRGKGMRKKSIVLGEGWEEQGLLREGNIALLKS